MEAADLTKGPLFWAGTVEVFGLGPPKLAIRFRLAPLFVGEYCSCTDDEGGVATDAIIRKYFSVWFSCPFGIYIITHDFSPNCTPFQIALQFYYQYE
jgi:hypothetical protein